MPIILRPSCPVFPGRARAKRLRQPVPAAAEAPRHPRRAAAGPGRSAYGIWRRPLWRVIRRVARSDELAAAPKAVRIEAFKLQAFSYCVSNYTQLCEDAFVRILHLDPVSRWRPTKPDIPPGAWSFGPRNRKPAPDRNRSSGQQKAADMHQRPFLLPGLAGRAFQSVRHHSAESSDGVSAAGASGSPPTVTGHPRTGWPAAGRLALGRLPALPCPCGQCDTPGQYQPG